jgi:hypothetical protein
MGQSLEMGSLGALVSWWFILFLGESTLWYGHDNSDVSRGQEAADRGPLEGGQ